MKFHRVAPGLIVCFLLFAVFTACQAQQLLRATFHMSGVTGEANITMDGDKFRVDIVISERMDGTTLEIMPIWTYYDVEDKCSSSNLGQMPFRQVGPFSLDASTPQVVFVDDIQGLNLTEGHTLVLRNDKKTICATIQQVGSHVTAVAQFQGRVLGTVYFRQHNDTSSLTRIVSDLYTKENVQNATWKISDSYGDCSAVKSVGEAVAYNPGSVSGQGCGENNQQLCAVGELTQKLGKVSLGSGKGEAKQGLSDDNLPLMGNQGVGNKLLLIYFPNDNTPVCAVIRVFTGRTATAKFSHEGVTGSVEFRQASPLDTTETVVDLTGLGSKARGYHVHLWPRPMKMFSEQELCSGTVVSGHFNPYNKDTTSQDYPPPAAGTNDMYEIGDLSAKYGTLKNALNKSAAYTDWNLPLYGKNSIIGRSVVIHRDDDANSRWICTNINPHHSVFTARARFTYPVIGDVIFMQAMDQPESETSIFAQLDYNNAMEGTKNHLWMVNTKQALTDMLSADEMTRCKSTGSIFNPQNLWPSLDMAQYNTECMNNKPFACKTGDLSGKLGALHIRNSGSDDTSRRQFFTDMNLPLSGPYSIVGKSLVIMNGESSGILSCANIEMLHPPQLVAQMTMAGVGGMVKFNQMAGFGDQETAVRNELTGVAENHRLRIHELPPKEGDNSCSDLGPMYDPLNVTAFSSVTTDDQYKAGDLSRHGISGEWSSFNLPLSGITSIVGRSLVAVDINNSDKIVACAKINFHLSDAKSQHVMAVSTFTGQVAGKIHLIPGLGFAPVEQSNTFLHILSMCHYYILLGSNNEEFQALYSDGSMSDTSILMDLKNQDGRQTLDHNWHTHQKPVYGDANAETGPCSSTGPHYDPFNTTAGSDNYKAECKPSNPLRCELGDQSNKLGTYSVGIGRKVFTDIYEPLSGMFSVLGRSFVVHVPNKGAPRQACGDIIPVTQNPVRVVFKAPATLNKYTIAEDIQLTSSYLNSCSIQWKSNSMILLGLTPLDLGLPGFVGQEIAEVYAKAIGAKPEDIVIEHISDEDDQTTVHVHFMGLEGQKFRKTFLNLRDNKDLQDKLKPYAPSLSAANVSALSSILLLMVMALQLILRNVSDML